MSNSLAEEPQHHADYYEHESHCHENPDHRWVDVPQIFLFLHLGCWLFKMIIIIIIYECVEILVCGFINLFTNTLENSTGLHNWNFLEYADASSVPAFGLRYLFLALFGKKARLVHIGGWKIFQILNTIRNFVITLYSRSAECSNIPVEFTIKKRKEFRDGDAFM